MSGYGRVGGQVVFNVAVGRMVGWKNMDEVGTENASIHNVTFLLYAEVTGDDEAAAGVGGNDCYPPK